MIIVISALLILDVLIYVHIFTTIQTNNLAVYFLDVGQGDSELVRLPAGVEILIDGGPPNNRAIRALADVMPFTDRYIDLVLLTHAQTDHFGGLMEVLRRYKVGAFLWNGRSGDASLFAEFKRTLQEHGVDSVVVSAGDSICHQNNCLYVLAPNSELLLQKDINNTSVVTFLAAEGVTMLFTGDIGNAVEKRLLDAYALPNIDVLKVSHNGSRYASSRAFLAAIQPLISVIEVGKNSYGHPSPDALERLTHIGAKIFRTDIHGTIKISVAEDEIIVHTTK